nr:hypothetical protein [Tanacetum cinerariifolium]
EEGQDEEDKEDELYKDVNINLGRGIQMGDVHQTQEFEDSHVTLTSTPDAGMESIFETISQMDVQTLTSVAPLPMSAPTLTPLTIATITTTQQAPIPPTIAPSTVLQDLPNFSSLFGFDHRLKTLEAKSLRKRISLLEPSLPFPGSLRDEAQKENDKFLKTIDENMQKIIKEQVKEQVKTSYVVAADLSKMELKKILIEKMEGNKSIHRSNEQRNLYKDLVEAYESDKIILDTYGDTVTLKRRRDDDADKDEEPFAGSDRGSKRRKEGNEQESASAPHEKATRSADKSTQGSKSRQTSASEFAIAEEPMQTTFEMEEPSHPEFEAGFDDQPIVEHSQHPKWFSQQKKPPTLGHFSNFLMNRLKVDTLTSELLAGPTYELMKGSCKSLVELEFFLEEFYKETTDQLDWVNPEDDRLKGIRMKYLPQSIWWKSDKDRAASMIQAIDKRLKTRRIMRSLERSILTDLQVTPTKPRRMTKPYSSNCFIANCFNAKNLKIEMQECKVTVVQACDVNMVVTESIKENENSESGISSSIYENATKADGADIIPTYDTDSLEHVDNNDYNVFALETKHLEQPEYINDTYMVKQVDTHTTPDSSDMSNNGREADHDDDLVKERELLASLIKQMKCEIVERKQNNKSLESSNKALREANTFLNTKLNRNSSKIVSKTSPTESIGSNDLVHNYYLEEVKKKGQIQKEQALNSKPSMITLGRLPHTASGSKPKPKNWSPSISSRVLNKVVNIAKLRRNSKPFLNSTNLACPTCKKCIYNANQDACILHYLSEVNYRASAQTKGAQSSKTTKRYIPVEKKSDANKHERWIFSGHRFSPNKSFAVYVKTMPPRYGHTWKPTGKILTYVIILF